MSWRAVFWGLGLEFLFGLFVLRTTPGVQAFQWLGNQIQVLCLLTLSYAPLVGWGNEGLGYRPLLGRSEMSGKELMDTSILPCHFSTCRSSWATPQLALALSLGTRSFRMSLPSRSAWGTGCGNGMWEGGADPGFLGFLLAWLGPGGHGVECSWSRAQTAQGWVSLSFLPTHRPPRCHGGSCQSCQPGSVLWHPMASSCGTRDRSPSALRRAAQPSFNPLLWCLACRLCPSLSSSAV